VYATSFNISSFRLTSAVGIFSVALAFSVGPVFARGIDDVQHMHQRESVR